MNFGLILRAYAPFKRFGGFYRGDNRGPTASSAVTSRVKAWVWFDPIAGTIGSPESKSDESHFAGMFSFIKYNTAGIPNSRISAVKVGSNSIFFRLSASGSNPLFPGAPGIDMQVSMTANVCNQRLIISADLTGDSFPNVEIILSDEGGEQQLLCTYETDGGADTGPLRLFARGKNSMSGLSWSYSLTDAGRFR
ncbi:MAG: hypothetical protein JWN04_3150 [Myxococcaceae bacterium]|nr:hypothetical protein [Myxococcaceae bacterium]